MQFVHPQFLWALSLLAVPIIIHLFSFKKARRVEFSRVDFLKQLKEQSRSRRRVKDWILLLLRCLTIALVVLAFARPYIPNDASGASGSDGMLGIYLDNSLSMEIKGERGRSLDRAKELVGGILDNLPLQSKVILITADLEGKDMHPRSPDEARRAMTDVELSLRSTTIADGVATLHETAESYGLPLSKVFVLSDFQRQQLGELDNMDSEVELNLVRMEAPRRKNYYIDSVWFDDPVQKQGVASELFFRVHNDSDDPAEEVMISMTLNDRNVGKTFVSIPANQVAESSISVTTREAGTQRGSLSLEDGSVYFDDRFLFTWDVAERIMTACVSDPRLADSVGRVMKLDSIYQWVHSPGRSLSPEQLNSADFVVLSDASGLSDGMVSSALDKVSKGGALLLMAGQENSERLGKAMAASSSGLLRKTRTGTFKGGDLKVEHPFFNGVFETSPERIHQPTFAHHYPVDLNSAMDTYVLWETQDGRPLLLEKRHGAGYVYTLLADPYDGSNFLKHALFPTLLLRIAEHGRTQKQLFVRAGTPSTIPVEQADGLDAESVELSSAKGEAMATLPLDHSEKVAQVRISGLEKMNEVPGFYDLRVGTNVVGSIAVDPNPIESNQDFLEEKELKQWANVSQDAKVNVSADHAGLEADLLQLNKEYWRLLLILALIILATEMALSRLFYR